MGQKFHPEIYRQAGRNFEAKKPKITNFEGTSLNSVIARLRHVHIPILLVVLRFRGRDTEIAETLMQQTLLNLGFLDRLPNGDSAIMCVGHAWNMPAGGRNLDTRITRILSRKMQRLSQRGIKASCLVAFAHLWSDECQNEPDIISQTHLHGETMIEIR